MACRWSPSTGTARKSPAAGTCITATPSISRSSPPQLDRAFSALLDDLSARGLLDETLVVWMGEFGRAPLIEREGGRGHWGRCYSVVLAGAGIKPGIVHGRSDRRAAYPVDGAVSPQDLVTTIYHCLGIATDTELTDTLGRPLRLCQGNADPGRAGVTRDRETIRFRSFVHRPPLPGERKDEVNETGVVQNQVTNGFLAVSFRFIVSPYTRQMKSVKSVKSVKLM